MHCLTHQLAHPFREFRYRDCRFIHLHKKRIAIFSIYLLQASILMIYDLEVCLSSVFYNTDYIVRMDNLNIDLLISPQDTHAHYLQNIISLCSMKQIIDTPTRITSNCASLLYLIFLFLDLRVLESGVYDEIDVSDHRIIYAYLNIEKSHRPSHKRLCRNLNSISAEALENMIIQIGHSFML